MYQYNSLAFEWTVHFEFFCLLCVSRERVCPWTWPAKPAPCDVIKGKDISLSPVTYNTQILTSLLCFWALPNMSKVCQRITSSRRLKASFLKEYWKQRARMLFYWRSILCSEWLVMWLMKYRTKKNSKLKIFTLMNPNIVIIIIIHWRRAIYSFTSSMCWFVVGKQQNTINHTGICRLMLPNAVLWRPRSLLTASTWLKVRPPGCDQ